MQAIVSKEIWDILRSAMENMACRIDSCEGEPIEMCIADIKEPLYIVSWSVRFKPHETFPQEARRIIFDAIERYTEEQK